MMKYTVVMVEAGIGFMKLSQANHYKHNQIVVFNINIDVEETNVLFEKYQCRSKKLFPFLKELKKTDSNRRAFLLLSSIFFQKQVR